MCESVNKGVIERPRDGKNVYAHERMSEQVELEEESQGLPGSDDWIHGRMEAWKLCSFGEGVKVIFSFGYLILRESKV